MVPLSSVPVFDSCKVENMFPEDMQLLENVPLGPLTTMGVGGRARYLLRIGSEAGLREAVSWARTRQLPIFVLGGGSNLLVADDDFPGLALQVDLQGPTELLPGDGRVEMRVPAGRDWDEFVLEVCRAGLSGVESLAGIPGRVGGTPVQNVGAYGQEVAQTISGVRALDLACDGFVDLTPEQCRFGYRSSIFNTTHRGRYIVTAVNFSFDPAARPDLRYADLRRHFGETKPAPIEVYHAVRAIRQSKGMLLTPGDADCRSAGSFFKNPVVPADTLDRIAEALRITREQVPHWPAADGRVKLPAAWLLEQAGFAKGYELGRAAISSRHSLALVAREGASYREIATLRDRIREEVERRFGVALEQEPVELPRIRPT